MTFSRIVWMVDNLLFFVYWFLDWVRSIKEVQKLSRVNNGRCYQSQSNVSAHMGIMRRRSIFEDIDQLPTIWCTTQLTYINCNS